MQTHAARALAGGAERLEPTSSRIILLLRRLSVAVLAEGGWVDSVPLATRQGQLDLTACDPCGTRRVGQAWWGGAGLPRDAPGRSRRAQRARHALPEAGRVPGCAPLRRASSTSPPCDRLGARRVGRAVQGGRAGRCWVPACGGGPLPKARTSCPGCACAWSCGATHGTEARACWCRRAIGATLQRPWSALLTATGPQRRPQALGRHDAPQRPEPPPASACCWYLCRG